MGGLSHYFSVLVWIEHLWKSPSVMWWIHVEDIIFCAGRKWFDQGAVKESEPNWQNTCQPWRNSRQIHHKVCCDILVHNRRRHPSSLGRHLRNSFHSSGWETGPESCRPNEITGRLAGSHYWKSVCPPLYFDPIPSSTRLHINMATNSRAGNYHWKLSWQPVWWQITGGVSFASRLKVGHLILRSSGLHQSHNLLISLKIGASPQTRGPTHSACSAYRQGWPRLFRISLIKTCLLRCKDF